jgi:hypothetical protein
MFGTFPTISCIRRIASSCCINRWSFAACIKAIA